jgi:hypothetical protein
MCTFGSFIVKTMEELMNNNNNNNSDTANCFISVANPMEIHPTIPLVFGRFSEILA